MQESPARSTSNVSKFKRYISVKNNDNHTNYDALKKSGMWTSKNPLTICPHQLWDIAAAEYQNLGHS